MNVLQVIGTLAPSYGGPSIAIPMLCRGLSERGHHVELFSLGASMDEPERTPNSSNGCEFAVTTFPVWGPETLGISPRLRKELRKRAQEFDIVHIHSLYGSHTRAASRACRRQGIPYVVSPHGSLDPYHWRQKRWKKAPYERFIERPSLNASRAIVVNSAHERRGVELLGFDVPTRIVPQGVARPAGWKDFRDAALRTDGPSSIVYIGRVATKKRIDLLVDAFAAVAASRSDVELVIAGPSQNVVGDALRAQIARLGLGNRIRLVGGVYGDEKWKLLARASMFVLPSEDESFGVAVAEAMAAGVPVIVSDGVALHAEVMERGAGVVVERSVSSVAEAIERLLRAPDLAATLGRRGMELATSEFSWSCISAKSEAVYLEAARRG